MDKISPTPYFEISKEVTNYADDDSDDENVLIIDESVNQKNLKRPRQTEDDDDDSDIKIDDDADKSFIKRRFLDNDHVDNDNDFVNDIVAKKKKKKKDGKEENFEESERKRILANSQERDRMNKLNSALSELRK